MDEDCHLSTFLFKELVTNLPFYLGGVSILFSIWKENH